MNNIEQRIDEIFSRWQQELGPGGQVTVKKGGKLIYQKNFGYANIEHNIPVKDETVFHVASISKQITVMCVLLLQEDGQLKIDDDIRKYVSEYINFQEPVTIRQMMNNVSGIRDQWELLGLSGVRIVDTITQRDALSIISKQKKLNFQPQSQWLYSNSNFTLLAEIVESLSGKTLNEFATERIFKPLGMDRTCFKDDYWKMIQQRASSYYDDGTGNFVYSVLNFGTYGATSLNTTACDFLKWLENFKNPLICSEETLDMISENPTLTDGTVSNYAGGLFVGEHRGHQYIHHGGSDAGFRSAIIRFTDEDLDIVLFANTQNTLMKDAAFSVADVVFGYEEEKLKEEQPKEYTEKFAREDLAGYYFALPDSDSTIITYQISLKEGQPHMENSYGFEPLTHVSGNHYKIAQLNQELYLGENSVLKTQDKLIPLEKLEPFETVESEIFKGRYESSELDTCYDIIEKNGLLHISHSRNGEQLLYQIAENKFVTNFRFAFIIEFIKEQGEITGFAFTGNRVKNVILEKVKK